jgi:hypothetical protein
LPVTQGSDALAPFASSRRTEQERDYLQGLGADEIIDARELSGAAAEAMVRAYIEDVFNRISIALGTLPPIPKLPPSKPEKIIATSRPNLVTSVSTPLFRRQCEPWPRRPWLKPAKSMTALRTRLDASIATFERTFDAAGQGAAAFNRKIIDIAQRNVNSVFDLAKSLAGAKDLADIVELQAAYWQKQFSALTAQAEEVRALSTKVTAAAAEPIKAHVARGADELRKVN